LNFLNEFRELFDQGVFQATLCNLLVRDNDTNKFLYYRLLPITFNKSYFCQETFFDIATIRVDYAQLSYIRTHTNKTSKNVWKKIRKQRDTKVPLIANYLILHLSLQRIRIFRKINYKKETREKCKFSRVIHCQKYFSRNSRTFIKLKNYLFNNSSDYVFCFSKFHEIKLY